METMLEGIGWMFGFIGLGAMLAIANNGEAFIDMLRSHRQSEE